MFLPSLNTIISIKKKKKQNAYIIRKPSINNYSIETLTKIKNKNLIEFLGGFAANVGACPITVAEIWGIYFVLLLAWNKGFCQIMLEVDSSGATDLINKEFNSKHPYVSVINSVQQLLRRNWMVRIQHVFCEANRATNFLTSCGHVIHLSVYYYDFPLLVQVLFLEMIQLGFLSLGMLCSLLPLFLGVQSRLTKKKKS